jgi:uncharacterized protein (TIGR01777 family)
MTGERHRVVLAGGSGSLGRRLADDLADRDVDVVVLSRNPSTRGRHRQVHWDGRSQGDWVSELQTGGPVSLVNLAGKLVDCRPTAANIAELTRSRVEPTTALVTAAAGLGRPLAHWVQASTTAIWSDAGEQWCDEGTPIPDPGLPQMTGVVRPWEDAAAAARCEHQVILRTSIVLDADAPAVARLRTLTRWGLGGRIGDGQQWFSWIHVDDWLAIVRACLGLSDIAIPAGVLVAATDHPVRNTDLMAELRRVLHRPPAPPTPAALMRLGAVVLRSDAALGLTGRRCRSRVLPSAGFTFEHPRIDGALDDLLA